MRLIFPKEIIEPITLKSLPHETQQQSEQKDCYDVPLPILKLNEPYKRQIGHSLKEEQNRCAWLDKLEKDLFNDYLLYQLDQKVRPIVGFYHEEDLFQNNTLIILSVKAIKNELMSKTMLRGIYKHADAMNKSVDNFSTTAERMRPWAHLVIPRWREYVQAKFDFYVKELYYDRLKEKNKCVYDQSRLVNSVKPKPLGPQSCYVTVPLWDILRRDLSAQDCAIFQLECFEAAITLTDQVAALAQVLPYAIKYVVAHGFKVDDKDRDGYLFEFDSDVRIRYKSKPAKGPRLGDFVRTFRSDHLSPEDRIPVASLPRLSVGLKHFEELFRIPHLYSIHSRYVNPERKRNDAKHPLWSIPNDKDFQFPPCPPNMASLLRHVISIYHKDLRSHWNFLYTKSLDRLLTILLGQRLLPHEEEKWAKATRSREPEPQVPAPEIRKQIKEDLKQYYQCLEKGGDGEDLQWFDEAKTILDRLFDPQASYQYKVPEKEPTKHRHRKCQEKPEADPIQPTEEEKKEYGCSKKERLLQIKEFCSLLLRKAYDSEKIVEGDDSGYTYRNVPRELEPFRDEIAYNWTAHFGQRPKLHSEEKEAIREVCNLLHPYIAPPTEKATYLNYDVNDPIAPPRVRRNKNRNVHYRRILRDVEEFYGKYIVYPSKIPFSAMSDDCIALQLPIIILADYIERAAGYKTRELELCPQISPSTILPLHLDSTALFELFGSKSGKYFLHDNNHRRITSSDHARKNKMVTMQNFFAVRNLERICFSADLRFDNVVEILPGALHANIRGKLFERISRAEHKKREYVSVDPSSIVLE
ncbi:hypothetical protein BJV82DRAFT_32833 [Fennellomyces sp. T-0311]|nr:hypothetical protein BJV82DRAFT_32833 [Fennellomyces sp. T-0311]